MVARGLAVRQEPASAKVPALVTLMREAFLAVWLRAFPGGMGKEKEDWVQCVGQYPGGEASPKKTWSRFISIRNKAPPKTPKLPNQRACAIHHKMQLKQN